MDNFGNYDSGQNRPDQTGERYPYSLRRPEGGLPPSPPPQKPKKRNSGVIALVLVMCILCAGAGGVTGYWAAGFVSPPAAAETTDAPAAQTPQAASAPQASQAPDNTYEPVASDRKAMSSTEIYEKCNPAVVAISTETAVRNAFGQSSSRASAGSGFLISHDGLIVTNYHVIDGADTIKVLTADGGSYDATVIGGDVTADLAVLSIQTENMPYLSFGDSEAMRVGDMVAAIGNPLGELANTQTVGTVSGLSREINIDGVPMVMLQTDAAISPGNSGGPLLNSYGEVIGVVSAKTVDRGVEGIGFAIPANSARADVADLCEHGYIQGRPYLGISMDPSYSAFARQYRQPGGVYVASVEPGSCAEKAGLKEGDVITMLGQDAITDSVTLQNAKLKYRAGETVTLKYLRDSQEQTTQITFDELKQAD